MLVQILQIIVCLLAAYGAVTIARSVIRYLLSFNLENHGKMRLVLLVQNREHDIEGIIRSFFSTDMMNRALNNSRLVVVDMSSTDETPLILERLCRYYGKLDLVRWQERNCIFDGFDNEKK